MKLVVISCLAALALAGCMPSGDQAFVARAPSAAAVEPSSTPETGGKTRLAGVAALPRVAPMPPPRPDFEAAKPTSRAIGALVKEARDIEDGKEPEFIPLNDEPAQTTRPAAYADAGTIPTPEPIAIFAPPERPFVAPASVTPAPAVVTPVANKPAGASPGFYAAYDDTVVNCFPPALQAALNTIAAHYNKPVEVTSGMRQRGRSHSMHRYCMAADIRVEGVGPRALAAFAKTVDGVNGVGTYRYTDVTHVDIRQEKFAWRY